MSGAELRRYGAGDPRQEERRTLLTALTALITVHGVMAPETVDTGARVGVRLTLPDEVGVPDPLNGLLGWGAALASEEFRVALWPGDNVVVSLHGGAELPGVHLLQALPRSATPAVRRLLPAVAHPGGISCGSRELRRLQSRLGIDSDPPP